MSSWVPPRSRLSECLREYDAALHHELKETVEGTVKTQVTIFNDSHKTPVSDDARAELAALLSSEAGTVFINFTPPIRASNPICRDVKFINNSLTKESATPCRDPWSYCQSPAAMAQYHPHT